nr:hypothetical protein [Tanacetum cinerariifolium]
QEFWATANVHQHSIQFKMDNKKYILDLESFRNILHICPRVQGQTFAELPFKEEILDFIRFLGHSATIRTLTDNTQHFGALLPIELTNEEIRNSKAYKEYHAIAIGEAAPKPKASARRTRSGFDISITPPTATATSKPTAAVTLRLTAAAKGKQTAKAPKTKSLSAPSEPGGSGTDEGTGSKPGVPDVPTDESEEELSWNSTDDEGVDDEGKNGDYDEEDERDDDDEGEEDDDDENKDGRSDEHESDKETREEESFDPIPQTPKDSEDESDGEEDLDLNIGEEERHDEEEEEDELYRDVNINQGRRLQGTLEVEDIHVTLTLVKPNGQQESSSVSSQFVTSMLNLTIDVGMESIFETTSRTDVQTLPLWLLFL